ncbi:allatostatin-A receptor-like [Ptychodera flava]|uniref:allatostatin-A receptor-like n=1 Tax=Ptychodera flava TaxID=63121 RepID=UPI00396A204F
MEASDDFMYNYSANFTLQGAWRLDKDDLDALLYSERDVILVTIVMPIVFTIGILGNSLVVYVFARVREMQTVTNYFLVNLAVADMLFLLSVVPPKLIQYYSTPFPIQEDWSSLGDWGCTIISYPSAVAITASSITIVLLAFEKFVAVRWPFRFKTLRTKPKAIVACTSVWIVSAIYSFPEIYILRLSKHELSWPSPWNNTRVPTTLHICIHSCTPDGGCAPYDAYYMFDRVVLILVVPLLAFLYLLTLIHLRERAGTGTSTASVRAKKQVVRMLIATTLIYLICVTPFRFVTLFQTLHDVNMSPETFPILLHVSRVLMYINSAINPAIYNVLNERYRRAFREALCSFRVERQRHITQTCRYTPTPTTQA